MLLISSFLSLHAQQNNCSNLRLRYRVSYASSSARCGAPSSVSFQNRSYRSAASSTLYSWYINDSLIGQSTGLQNIAFSYSDTGVYQLKMVGRDTAAGCADSIEEEFLVYDKPTPSIISTRDTVCAGSMVYFSPTVQDSWRYTSYYWRLPDNSRTSDTTTGFLFTNTGRQRVGLRVRNTPYCETWVTKYIYVTNSNTTLRLNDLNGNPSTNPTWENCILAAGTVDTFQLILTTPDSVFNYTIDYGDGNTLAGGTDTFTTGDAIYHTYQNLGTYTLTIVGEDRNGCRREVRGTVINERIPTAGIIGPPSGNQSGCAPLAVRFINSSYNISNSTTFTWTYGDGVSETFSSSNASDTIWHTYRKDAADCNLEVTLTADNACGTSIATWAYVNVFDEDDVSLSANNGYICSPDSTITLNVNIDRNCVGGQRFYYWDFGDGRNSGWTTSAAPRTVIYNTPGTYQALVIDSNVCGADTAIYTVTVREALRNGFTTGFTLGNPNNCAPVTIQVTDTSTGVANNTVWNFGDGTVSTLANPSHTYSTAGTFLISLARRNECESIVANDTITVYGKPDARIATIDSTCYPATVSFTNQTPLYSPNATFYWTLPDNSTSTMANPGNMTINTPGDYQVTLIVTDSCGADTVTQDFRILNFPTASFTAGNACEGNPITFNNTSSIGANDGNITSYLWRFGDGNASTSRNAGHTYGTDGNYTVTLIATSGNGCVDSVQKGITVFDQPGLSLSKSAVNYCPGIPVQLGASVSLVGATIDSIAWDFGDGQTSYDSVATQHAFTNAGNYMIGFWLQSNQGCYVEDSVSVIINANPSPQIDADTVCLGDSTTLHDLSNVTSRQWDMDMDGAFETNIDSFKWLFSTAGINSAIIQLTSIDGCQITDTFQIQVSAIPIAQFSQVNDSICQGDSLFITNNSSNADSFFWTQTAIAPAIRNGGGNMAFGYDSSGLFQVSLIAKSGTGCYDTTQSTVRVIQRPIARFSYVDSIECAPFPVVLNNLSQNTVSHEWLVNGSPFVTGQTFPGTAITAPGDTTIITLIANNVLQCHPDTFIREFITFDNPNADFTRSDSNGCGPLSVSFSNQSAGASGYLWVFGNGDSSLKAQPTTVFAPSLTQDSFYQVQLVATSANGCSDTAQKQIQVYPAPVSNFSMNQTNGCGPLAVQFTNTSSPNDTGSINHMTFEWNFDNGIVSAAVDSALSFTEGLAQDTLYEVKLVAYSEHGCVDSNSKSITVYPTPRVRFDPNNTEACHPFQLNLNNKSHPKDTGNIGMMTFQWSLPNSQSATRNQQLTLSNTGLTDSAYSVKLLGTSEHGCKDSTTQSFTVHPNPSALLSTNDSLYCKKDAISVFNQSVLADTSYFNYGDALKSFQVSGTTTQSKSYKFPGYYNITLRVQTRHGCEDLDTLRLGILEWPEARFSSPDTSGCAPMSFSFKNQSRSADSFEWLVNNLSLANTQSLVNQTLITPADSMLVQLVAKNRIGCHTDTTERFYRTHRNPDVSFEADTTESCGDSNFKFKNLTSYYANLLWDFGEGSKSVKKNPKQAFVASTSQDTQYVVKLVATTRQFCTDSITDTITLHPIPRVDFSMDKTDGCGPLQVQFSNLSHPKDTGNIGMMRFQWNLGNDSVSILQSPSSTYLASNLQDSIYTVSLLGFSEHNCMDSSTESIRVYPKPEVKFSASALRGCHPLSVQFINQSSPKDTGSISIMSFEWVANGGTSLLTNITDTFLNTGNTALSYNVGLMGTSEHGCIDSTQQAITVYPSPESSFSLSQDSACQYDSFLVSNTSKGADSFIYYWGDGATMRTIIKQTENHAYKQLGSFNVSLKVFNGFGCSDSSASPTTTIAWPNAAIRASHFNGCAPQVFSFKNQSANALNYQWWQGSTLISDSASCPDISLLNPSDTVQLALIASNTLGCHDDTAAVLVYTHPDPVADFRTDTSFGCGPLRVRFTSQSTLGFIERWQFEQGQSSTGSAVAHTFSPSNSQDTTYTVKLVAQTIWGCIDSMEKDVKVYPKPVAGFIPSTDDGCGPLEISFDNLSHPKDTGSIRIMTFNWDFGNGQLSSSQKPNAIFTASETRDTIYKVRLKAISEHGCIDSAVESIRLYPDPDIRISPTVKHGCGPLNVQFVNLSSPNDVSSIFDMKFRWDYGNGDTSSGILGNSTFSSPVFRDTIYVTQIIGYSEHGCSDTTVVPIKVHPNPKAAFKPSALNGCSPLKLDFTNLSSPNDTGGLANMEFIWQFENGIISRSKMPSYTYYNFASRDTSHEVQLIAMSKWNCKDTISKNITIHHLPRADFNTNTSFSCSPLRLETQNTSSYADSFSWHIGKQIYGSAENINTTLESTVRRDSIFEITLKAITDDGCTATAKRNIQVFRKVKAKFLAGHKGCTPYDAEFVDESKNAVIHSWDLGDGFTSNEPNPQHRYTKEGSYKVRLKVTDITGCSDSTEMPNAVRLNKTPDARITLDTLVNELPNAVFTMQPTVWVSDGTVKYQWKAKGQATNNSPVNTYTFNDKGAKEIWLTAATDFCEDSTSEIVDVILPIPTPGFNSDIREGCVALEIAFTDTSKWAEEVEWFFGDGKSSKARNPVHTYELPGTYKVSQKVSNERGQNFTIVEDYIEVFPLPFVDFDPTPKVVFLPEADVTFNNFSYNTVAYEWYADEVFFSNDTTPELRFVDEGEYDIMLIGYSDKGCVDTMVHENLVKVRARGDVFIPTGFTPDGDGRNDGFRPIGYGIEADGYYLQIFNRWGQRVFETSDKEENWDGTFNGVECQMDVYVWVVRLEFAHGEIRYEEGNVTLMR